MNKPLVHRPYLGETAEERVEARRRALVDAAFERLASEGGFRELSIAQLCRDAQLNKRYFYESFDDLDQVAAAVVDELASELLRVGQTAAIEGMGRGLDTPALARHALAAVLGWFVEDPRRAKTLFTSVGDHPSSMAHRQDAIDKLAAGLSAFSLDYHRASTPHPIVQVGSALLIGGSIEVVLAWLGGRMAISLEELVDDLAGFWVAIGDDAIARTKQRLERANPGRPSGER